MERPYDVMAAGHLCLDVIPRFPDTGAKTIGDIIRPGKLVEMEEVKMCTGGPVSNTGINLKTLGCKLIYCARIGDDEFGRLTRAFLEQNGNAGGIHVVQGSASSYTIALAPPGIDRVFLHNPGTNHEFGPEDLQPELIAQCRHFHFGYPPLMRRMFENDGMSLQQIFKTAKEAGATTSLDMALPDPDSASGKAPWMKILENILPYVDICLPSIEEVFFMLEPKSFLRMKEEKGGAELIDFLSSADYTRLADRLLSLGCKMTALKSGHRGFYFKTKSKDAFAGMGAAKPGDMDAWSARELWCPAFNAPNLASATGSGDSSIAGFIAAFLRGNTLETSLKYANMVGWENVQELDAISGIQTWERTTELLGEKKPMNEVHINNSGWKWSDKYELWAAPGDPLHA